VKLPPSLRGHVPEHDDPRYRAEELVGMFADPEVDVVQSYDAGYGTSRLLPHLDFETVRRHPKPFVGYSDVTTLHIALRHHVDLVTFYGPLFVTMGRPRKTLTLDRLLRARTPTDPLGEIPRDPDAGFVRSFNGGRATGPLVGGCLWPIMQAVGTPWQLDLRGRILLFEDIDKPPYLVAEQLTQLHHAGVLDGVAGIVVGEMRGSDWRNAPHAWPRTMSIEDVFEELLEPLGVPIVYGLPLGHGHQLVTVPLGATVTVDADRGSVTVDEPALTS
jgi:muramoyltetrapeptide carboxypeptidase